MNGNEDLSKRFPAYARKVIDVLEAAGYEAWAVGGWVRDALRGVRSHDIDVTTNASWRQVATALQDAGIAVHETGTAHGTVTAVCAGHPVEVTTYRVEGPYTDHRHPDTVLFVQSVQDDLARRDLTINAMAWHPVRGLLDPFGGRRDIEARVIRAVGDPHTRFCEDALRVLRAVRFGVRLGYSIDPATQEALVACAPSLAMVAQERIGQELDAIVRSGKVGKALLEQPEVMCQALPELAACRGFDQRSPFHIYDVYEHIAHVCNACQAFTAGMAGPELQWAALLHDVGKPAMFSQDVEGRGHFFMHPQEGARMAKAILRRLSIPSSVAAPAVLLVRLHDDRIPATPRAIRRLLQKFYHVCAGRETSMAFALFDLCRADAVSKTPSVASWASELDAYSTLLRKEVAAGPMFSVRHLAVTGADVMRVCGMRPGPGVGMQLDMLLAAVMADEVSRTREDQLAWLCH